MKQFKIYWVTAGYMLQVDLPVLKYLNKYFDIDWHVVANPESSTGRTAKEYAETYGLKLTIDNLPYREIDPRFRFEAAKVLRKAAAGDYDIYYFDISTFPWLLGLIKKNLPEDRVILAMHHGKPHSGMRFKRFYFPFLRKLNASPFNLQYFSNSQAEAFAGTDPSKRYIIPLALNDFGVASKRPSSKEVVFTNFGNIIDSKNLSLLIRAADELWEVYPGKFKVKIIGHCRNWEATYAPLIKHPEAFELDIRRVEETEIPDIFASSHYVVLPYKSVTQSGPLRIAYGYGIPVIASDLDGFRESVEEGITGMLFESENVEALKEVMKRAITDHPNLYNTLRRSQKDYVDSHISVERVCSLYKEMFNKIAGVSSTIIA